MNRINLSCLLLLAATSASAMTPDRDDVRRGESTPTTAAAFEAQHSDWDKLADGVYQHIDQSTGAISEASVGLLGLRHDLAAARKQLAIATGDLNLIPQRDSVRRQDALDRIAERNAEIRSLDLSLAKAIHVFTESQPCDAYIGRFIADFSKTALVNGGQQGNVSTSSSIECEWGGIWCPPANAGYAPGFNGYARSYASAQNIAGTNSQSTATEILPVSDGEIHSLAAAQTKSSNDPNCKLTATGRVNTTSYNGCVIYFNRSETRYCNQIAN